MTEKFKTQLKKFYQQINWNNGVKETCKQLKEQFPHRLKNLSLSDINAICLELTPEEQKKVTKGLVCPQCNTSKYLVAEPRGGITEDEPCRGYDVYCKKPTPDSMFSHCFYHFKESKVRGYNWRNDRRRETSGKGKKHGSVTNDGELRESVSK